MRLLTSVRLGTVLMVTTVSLLLGACASQPPTIEKIEVETVAAPDKAMPIPLPLPAPVAAAPAPAETLGKLVTVWYGTTRQPLEAPTEVERYGNLRDGRMHFGTVDVKVPQSHRRGSLGSALRFVFTGKDEPLSIQRVGELGEDDFWRGVRAQLASVDAGERRVLLFIHGYKNSFSDAALRTAQLWADLELKGLPAFYSWPSRDATLRYTVDEASVDVSERHLAGFLRSLAARSGARRLDVIAHSMGNRALLRVVANAANSIANSGIRLGQVFLVAPDVDLELFEQLASAYPKLSERTTLYVSRSDKAVLLSEGVHAYPRTGAPPPFVRVDKIDTVEVRTSKGLLELGHSYFAEFVPVLDDIHDLIMYGKPGTARRVNAVVREAKFIIGY